MIVRENRRTVIQQISKLLDDTCRGCATRKQMERDHGKRGQYAKIDGYCNRECPVGRKLQGLGKRLVRS